MSRHEGEGEGESGASQEYNVPTVAGQRRRGRKRRSGRKASSHKRGASRPVRPTTGSAWSPSAALYKDLKIPIKVIK